MSIPMLVLFFGAITLGQGYLVRHGIRGTAGELARACVLVGATGEEACAELARRRMSGSDAPRWAWGCDGPQEQWGLRVTSERIDLGMVVFVKVKLECAFGGLGALFPSLGADVQNRGDGQLDDAVDALALEIVAEASMPYVKERF